MHFRFMHGRYLIILRLISTRFTKRNLAARTFIQSQYLKELATSLRVGLLRWKRGFTRPNYFITKGELCNSINGLKHKYKIKESADQWFDGAIYCLSLVFICRRQLASSPIGVYWLIKSFFSYYIWNNFPQRLPTTSRRLSAT